MMGLLGHYPVVSQGRRVVEIIQKSHITLASFTLKYAFMFPAYIFLIAQFLVLNYIPFSIFPIVDLFTY